MRASFSFRQTQVEAPSWIRWAGFAAIVGGFMAVVLTVPFASAYFPAYAIEGESPPRWLQSLEPGLGSLLTFAAPETVYELYGKIFNLVYLLILPAVFGLHHLHRGTDSPKELWAFRVLVGGLIATSIGVAGDYWANGIGFPITVLGLLAVVVGTSLYGVATLRGGVLPRGAPGCSSPVGQARSLALRLPAMCQAARRCSSPSRGWRWDPSSAARHCPRFAPRTISGSPRAQDIL